MFEKRLNDYYQRKGYFRITLLVEEVDRDPSIILHITKPFEMRIELHEKFRREGFDRLLGHIKGYEFIHSISIQCAFLNDELLTDLCQVLSALTQLKSLSITCTKGAVTYVGMESLGQLICQNKSIETLNLEGISERQPNINHPLTNIVLYLKDSNITKVGARNNQLNSGECFALTTASLNVTRLDLTGNDIGRVFMSQINVRIKGRNDEISIHHSNITILLGPIWHIREEAYTRASQLFKELYKTDPPENDVYLIHYMLKHIRLTPEYKELCRLLIEEFDREKNSQISPEITSLKIIYEQIGQQFNPVFHSSFQAVEEFMSSIMNDGMATPEERLSRLYVAAKYCLQRMQVQLAFTTLWNDSTRPLRSDLKYQILVIRFCSDLVQYINYPFKDSISAERYSKVLNLILGIINQINDFSAMDVTFLNQLEGRSKQDQEVILKIIENAQNAGARDLNSRNVAKVVDLPQPKSSGRKEPPLFTEHRQNSWGASWWRSNGDEAESVPLRDKPKQRDQDTKQKDSIFEF